NASRIFDTTAAPAGAAISFAGFTITGGNAGAELFGGAIRGSDEFIYTSSCDFTGNSAATGGAIAITFGGRLVADSCSFTNNKANAGAAINVSGAGAVTQLYRCSITGNVSSNFGGGGIVAQNYLSLYDTTVAMNTATSGSGAGILMSGASATGGM